MTSASVVIGANFGDEGKGLMTDVLAARTPDALVVRFNGGAQAGHTVETPDGRRHVFSHFGSGSFVGAATYLSSFFVCNPMIFAREYAELAALGAAPLTHIDSACAITTPYDMMINQIAEDMRGTARHGSVGIGFGETLERSQHDSLKLTFGILCDPRAVQAILAAIRDAWVPTRLAALGITDLPVQWRERLQSDGIIQKYLLDAEMMRAHARTADTGIMQGKPIVFEGAQGLLLDEDSGFFPHVTRSHTGLRNVAVLAAQANIDHLRVHYMTRAYLTRHGAGPLPNETDAAPASGIIDATNRPHAYQGHLRFAPLNADLLRDHIARDLEHGSALRVDAGLVMTCLDQMDSEIGFYADGAFQTGARDEGYDTHIAALCGLPLFAISRGPTRTDVSPVPAETSRRAHG